METLPEKKGNNVILPTLFYEVSIILLSKPDRHYKMTMEQYLSKILNQILANTEYHPTTYVKK